MQYTKVGSLEVSRIGFGCYAMGGAYGAADPAAWQRQVELALDLGITLFDTAAAYGEAERWLGSWLGPDRERVVIATKFGLRPDRTPDASAAAVLRNCEESLARLATDWIDLYQVHFDDPRTPVAQTVAALEALKRRGAIREYGVGHLPPQRIQEYLQAGSPAALLCELSLAATSSLREVLPLARAAGAAGLAFSPTGRGLLTGRIGPETEFAPDDIRSLDSMFVAERRVAGLELAAELAGIGRELGATAAQMAVAWVLAQEGVAAALTGPSAPEHLRENAAAASLTLPPEVVADLSRRARELQAELTRQATAKMHETLAGPVSSDPTTATRALLAAIETALEAGLTGQVEVTPVALRLLRPGRREQPLTQEEMENIRRELAALIARPD